MVREMSVHRVLNTCWDQSVKLASYLLSRALKWSWGVVCFCVGTAPPLPLCLLLLNWDIYIDWVGLTEFDSLNSIRLGVLHHSLILLTCASWFTEPSFQLPKQYVTAHRQLCLSLIYWYATIRFSHLSKLFYPLLDLSRPQFIPL
jgi:hypothetical protein